jgi:16S rRNA (uracil1498-N3)-methyltransferase
MHLFYSPVTGEQQIELDQEESRHLAKVLRLGNGSKVLAVDGKGHLFHCQVLDPHPKKAVLQVLEKKEEKNTSGLVMAVAPTKNLNRWEWFLEKATEIGIDEIYPISTQHSERKVLKLDRSKKILIGAMKQSQKATLPRLHPLQTMKEYLKTLPEGEKYIAHCHPDISRESFHSIHPKGQKAVILIGPEGDFSKEEVTEAMQLGFTSVSLSKSRLRTETAAIVACTALNLLNE